MAREMGARLKAAQTMFHVKRPSGKLRVLMFHVKHRAPDRAGESVPGAPVPRWARTGSESGCSFPRGASRRPVALECVGRTSRLVRSDPRERIPAFDSVTRPLRVGEPGRFR